MRPSGPKVRYPSAGIRARPPLFLSSGAPADGDVRAPDAGAVAVPVTLALTLFTYYILGYTLNRITLFALIFSIGILVDDPIVDVENTVRHLKLGLSPLEAARESAREIAVPVLMATITTMVVFFPLTFMTGVGKHLFTPLAVSACMALEEVLAPW